MEIYLSSNDRKTGTPLTNPTFNIDWSYYDDCPYVLTLALISGNFSMTGVTLNGSVLIMSDFVDGLTESNGIYPRLIGNISFGAILYNSGGKMFSKPYLQNPVYLRGKPFKNDFTIKFMNSGNYSGLGDSNSTAWVMTLSFKKVNRLEFPVGRWVKRLFINSEEGTMVNGVRNNINYSYNVDINGKYIVSQSFQSSKLNVTTSQNIPLLVYNGWTILNTYGISNSCSTNNRSSADAFLYIYPDNNQFYIDCQLPNTLNLKLIDPVTNSLWVDGYSTVKAYALDLLFYPV